VGSQLRHRASALRRLHKTPNIWGHTYDLNEPGPHFDALIADLYEKSLAVVLELTEPDGFTYAWGDHAMLKFWPQRAERRQFALQIEGLWTPELQSLFDSCMTAESQSRDDHDEDRVRKDLAKLIVLTERRLKEHNIHYTSARDVHVVRIPRPR
jgi:hypothetical protein